MGSNCVGRTSVGRMLNSKQYQLAHPGAPYPSVRHST